VKSIIGVALIVILNPAFDWRGFGPLIVVDEEAVVATFVLGAVIVGLDNATVGNVDDDKGVDVI